MLGSFGTVRGADVDPKDLEIFYIYSESRNVAPTGDFTELDPVEVLQQIKNPNASSDSEKLSGFYTLKLPTENFKVKGFYYIYIKPKEIRTTIKDVGVLYSNNNIRGIVLDPNSGFTDDQQLVNVNNGLIGYRIEYINNETLSKIPNQFTIVTSSNKCEIILSGGENSSDVTSSYNITNSGNLLFLTLTPSSESAANPNFLPFIGDINQNIIITNTFVNPEIIELEVVEHDLDTLSWEIGGNRIMNVAADEYTIYNDNNEIYKQVKVFKKQNMDTNDVDYEISQKMDSIDESQDFETILNS